MTEGRGYPLHLKGDMETPTDYVPRKLTKDGGLAAMMVYEFPLTQPSGKNIEVVRDETASRRR